MGYRPTNDPFNGVEPIADKLIGNAYDTVRTVATNIAVVKHVSANLAILHNIDEALDDLVSVSDALATVAAAEASAIASATAATTAATSAAGSAEDAAASSAEATATLAGKAPIASPTFTGVATSPSFVGPLTGNASTATLLSAGADRTKLDGIATGATANSSDATLLARANHTGTQAISTVTSLQASLDDKAPLASPTLTGVPLAPTAAALTSTTQLATTAFVTTADNLKADLASPTFTGVPAAPTAAAATSTTQLATTAFVTTADNLKAPLASPTFTGTPAAPTAAAATNTTQLATTAFVVGEVATLSGTTTTALALKAPLASPTFTGVPAAPTAAAATNTTQIATTAFVTTADNLKANLASPTFTGTVTTAALEGTTLRGTAGSVGTPTFSFSTDTDTGLYSGGADILNLATGGVQRVNIDASGNVGFGMTAISVADVRSAAIKGASTGAGYSTFIVEQGTTSKQGVFQIDSSAGNVSLGTQTTNTTGTLTFLAAGAQVGTFSTAGNFVVSSNGVVNPGIRLEPLGSVIIGNNAASAGFGFEVYQRSAVTIGSITQSGTTGVSYNTTSDHRLKENVVPLSQASERVKALRPSRFNFISEPGRVIDGFLAHEVQAVVPEAVTGVLDGAEYQSMDASRLVPLLTAALQDALARIEALEARLP